MSSRLARAAFAAVFAVLLACGGTTSEPTAGPPAKLLVLEGATQLGTFGTPATVVPKVLVVDAANRPVSGVTVTFVPASGSGSVQTASATTLADGTATPGSWTLGGRFSAMTLTATVGALTPVTFSASALAPSAGILAFSIIDPAGDTLRNALNTAGRAHDVISLRGDFRRDSLILTLTFAAPVVDVIGAATMFGFIEVDTDESAASGSVPLSNGFGGTAAQLGIDYVITLSGNIAGVGTSIGSIATSFPIQISGSVMSVRIPMSALGSDDGRFGLIGIIGTQDRPTDVFPNTGSVVVRTAGSFVLPSSGGGGTLPSVREPVSPVIRWKRTATQPEVSAAAEERE